MMLLCHLHRWMPLKQSRTSSLRIPGKSGLHIEGGFFYLRASLNSVVECSAVEGAETEGSPVQIRQRGIFTRREWMVALSEVSQFQPRWELGKLRFTQLVNYEPVKIFPSRQ